MRMKIRLVHFVWLLLLGGALMMGALAFWLLGREADRVEDLARETLVNRATTAADNLDFLVSEIRTGISESLYALEATVDPGAGLARLVSGNPYIVAGFQVREVDGVTFWYGERGAFPDPSEILTAEVLNQQKVQLEEKEMSSFSLEREEAESDSLFEPLGGSSSAPTDRLQNDRLGSEPPEGEPAQLETVAEQAMVVERESVKAKSALKQQISGVRYLNIANRKEILESSEEVADQREMALAASAPEPIIPSDPFAGEPLTGALAVALEEKAGELRWIRLPGRGLILGAWLDTEALRAELAKALFLNERGGLRLRLSDPNGEILEGGETSGRYRSSLEVGETVEIPVGPSLAGWRLQAFETGANPFGQSFRTVGAVVVAGLVGAIIIAGSLLLRQARRDALEAQRKTTFVANVSHELKTPLTSIRMFAEMLAEGRVQNETKRESYLNRISTETQRLGRLVNNVLDFSRLDRKSRRFDLERVDLRAEVLRFQDLQAARLAEEGIVVEGPQGGEEVWAEIDRDALEQILLNLLDNAAKYASTGGRVCLEVGADPQGRPDLRVRDFGPGIPARERARVFRAFHRVDDRLTSEQSGCGLGLSISKRLAEGMGVEFSLEENHPQGCCFILRWPESREIRL